jgi:hypothetical protein
MGHSVNCLVCLQREPLGVVWLSGILGPWPLRLRRFGHCVAGVRECRQNLAALSDKSYQWEAANQRPPTNLVAGLLEPLAVGSWQSENPCQFDIGPLTTLTCESGYAEDCRQFAVGTLTTLHCGKLAVRGPRQILSCPLIGLVSEMGYDFPVVFWCVSPKLSSVAHGAFILAAYCW